MGRDRFLTGILIGIGTLVVLALILFFVRQQRLDYVDEGTPAGVMQNYILAVQRRDYQRAYTYLAEHPQKPDFQAFQRPFLEYQGQMTASTAVEIGETIPAEDGQSAVVQLVLLRGGQDIFDSSVYREPTTASLVLQDGIWKIRSAPHPFWSYGWSLESWQPGFVAGLS